jgi:hypothetical protein
LLAASTLKTKYSCALKGSTNLADLFGWNNWIRWANPIPTAITPRLLNNELPPRKFKPTEGIFSNPTSRQDSNVRDGPDYSNGSDPQQEQIVNLERD